LQNDWQIGGKIVIFLKKNMKWLKQPPMVKKKKKKKKKKGNVRVCPRPPPMTHVGGQGPKRKNKKH
jgi:hypothetical protein